MFTLQHHKSPYLLIINNFSVDLIVSYVFEVNDGCIERIINLIVNDNKKTTVF